MRKRLIENLKMSDPEFHNAFLYDLRKAEGESHFMRLSGRYPFCGRGDINVYTIFAEALRTLICNNGRMGCVLPSGIATDDTTKFFFKDIVDSNELKSLFSFFEIRKHFPGTDSRNPFCLLTVGNGEGARRSPLLAFDLTRVEDSKNRELTFEMSAEDFALLNPNTRTCPVFRTRRDAELTKAIYRRVPVLVRETHDGKPEENLWGIRFGTMFHMSNDSHLFRTREQLKGEGWELDGNVFRKGELEFLPLYEAKMIHHFDHRWGTYAGQTEAQANQGKLPEFTKEMHENPGLFVMPRYWVCKTDMPNSQKNLSYNESWLFGWREITRSTDKRTVISSAIPFVGSGNKILFCHVESKPYCLNVSLSTFCFDYICRQKMGGTSLGYFIVKQLPMIVPDAFGCECKWISEQQTIESWLLPRYFELTYTAWDLNPFSKDFGFNGPPFRWDEDRRFLLRCELDAAFFHLYLPANPDGTWKKAERETASELTILRDIFLSPREAVDYIMDTFNLVLSQDEAKYGEYRTKRVILEIYDELQQAMATAKPYQTRLVPPPADASLRHDAAYPSQPSAPTSEPLAQGVPLAARKVAAFPEKGREKVAYEAIVAMMRDFPEQTFRELCRASWLLTNVENCKALLPQQKQQDFMQAMQTSSLPQSFPEGQRIRFWEIEHRLVHRRITIYPTTGRYSIPKEFKFRDAPDMTKLAPYLFEALQRLDQATADPEVLTTAQQTMSQQMEMSKHVA